MNGMDTQEGEEIISLGISILDDATNRLLESDEDETKALQRYDAGDPQFMLKACDDMRRLDFLLQEQFAYENRQRKERKQHVKKLHQTLSEFQMTDSARHEVGREAKNTRKFLSATHLQYQAVHQDAEQERLDDVFMADSISDATNTRTATLQSRTSSVSAPRRIHQEELDNVDEQWAVVPFEDQQDEIQSFLEETKSAEASDTSANECSLLRQDTAVPKTKHSFSFRFDTIPAQINHVKHNIRLAGQYYTLEEKFRLNELLADPVIGKGNNALTFAYIWNPFTLFGEDLKALQDIDEMIQAVKRAHNRDQTDSSTTPRNTFGSGLEHCHFGFQKNYTDHEESAAASRRFMEITDCITEIEVDEHMMLSRIFEGRDVKPLESKENILNALEMAEDEILAITYTTEQAGHNSMALVPFVSEKELQLLLGPFPRCTNYPELNAKQWNADSFAMWKDWLEGRRKSLETMHEEMERVKSKCRNRDDNEDLLVAAEMENRFQQLMEDLRVVRSEVDTLISNNLAVDVPVDNDMVSAV